jgi:hypothetical protein
MAKRTSKNLFLNVVRDGELTERTKSDWSCSRPSKWPAFEEWTADVQATQSLSNSGTEKARAVQALGNVDPQVLDDAVTSLLESRALAFWVDSLSTKDKPIERIVQKELSARYPELLPSTFETRWGQSLFCRLIRISESGLRRQAISEEWYPVLRYKVLNHPLYHRIIDYNQRCHDNRSLIFPNPYPSFANWLAAADECFVGRKE